VASDHIPFIIAHGSIGGQFCSELTVARWMARMASHVWPANV
jgi:hypothetical protein